MLTNPFAAARLQRGLEHLHCLGPRSTDELLAEIDNRIGGTHCIFGLLTEYELRLTSEMLCATGGDRFPQGTVPPALAPVSSVQRATAWA
jgi:hypothetical protein